MKNIDFFKKEFNQKDADSTAHNNGSVRARGLNNEVNDITNLTSGTSGRGYKQYGENDGTINGANNNIFNLKGVDAYSIQSSKLTYNVNPSIN